MTLTALVFGFAAATATSQALLRGTKLQAGLGRVAAVHSIFAVALLVPLIWWGGVSPVALLLFWAGSGLAWFVVRSHLESSILLAILDELARGTSDCEELLRPLRGRHGLEARMRELEAAGLIGDEVRPPVTRKGRLVSAFFAALEGRR